MFPGLWEELFPDGAVHLEESYRESALALFKRRVAKVAWQ